MDNDRRLRLPRWLSTRSITAVAASLALVVVALGAAFVTFEHHEKLEHGEQGVDQLVRLLEDHANRTLASLDLSLTTLDEAVVASGHHPSSHGPLLLRSASGLPYLRSLSVIDGQGRVLSSSANDNVGAVIDPSRIALPEARQLDRLGGLVPGRDLADARAQVASPTAVRRHFIPLVRRVSGDTPQPLYLVAVLNPDFFPNEQALVLHHPHLNAALASTAGTLLTTTEGLQRAPGSRLDDHPFFTEYLPAHESGAYLGPGLDGHKVITAFRVLRHRPLAVIVESDHAVVRAATATIATWTGGVCLAALLLIAAVARVAARSPRNHAAVHVALVSTREERAASERRMRSLVESVQELIFRTDAAGRVSFVNQRWERLNGRRVDSVLGLRFAQLCLAADRPRIDAMFAMPARATEQPVMAGMLGRDGVTRTLEVSVAPVYAADGRVEGYAGFALDVTERQRARDALQAQLDFTARLIEICPTPLFVKDLRGRFINVNRAWLELMNLAPNQVLGHTSAELFAPHAGKHIEQDHWVLQSTAPSRYENHLVRADGEERDTVVTKARYTDAEGRAAGIIGSIVDVTEFREAERVTAEARDAAERANRAKSDFIATITHELRTPLQAIIGFSEMGGELARPQAELKEMFDEILGGGRRMLTLVNGLLDLAKMESAGTALNLAPTDLGELTTTVLRELRPLADARQLRFELPAPGRPLPAVADGARLQQVMRNVLANALRFAPVGTALEIDARDLGPDGVEWSVRDHGPGIPEAERHAIFEAFVQSSRTRSGAGGTGLGLTICHRIMVAHGGRIEAYNAPDGGAVFRLWLPVRDLPRAHGARRTTITAELEAQP
jgi:PAS domain S-box-containing protein